MYLCEKLDLVTWLLLVIMNAFDNLFWSRVIGGSNSWWHGIGCVFPRLNSKAQFISYYMWSRTGMQTLNWSFINTMDYEKQNHLYVWSSVIMTYLFTMMKIVTFKLAIMILWVTITITIIILWASALFPRVPGWLGGNNAQLATMGFDPCLQQPLCETLCSLVTLAELCGPSWRGEC